MSPRVPAARVDGLVIRELADEVLVYDLERHEAHCLDRASAAIWRRCDGRSTAEQIATGLGDEIAALDKDLVGVALRRLDKAHLLAQKLPKGFTPSLPRRELLKRVAAVGGLSVLSITVPTAALAASGCIASGSQAPGDCVNDKAGCTSADGRKCCSGSCSNTGKACGTGSADFRSVCN
jgi:hypothetical protein